MENTSITIGEHCQVSSPAHLGVPCPFNTVDNNSQVGSDDLYQLPWEPNIREYVDGSKYGKGNLKGSFDVFPIPSQCSYQSVLTQ